MSHTWLWYYLGTNYNILKPLLPKLNVKVKFCGYTKIHLNLKSFIKFRKTETYSIVSCGWAVICQPYGICRAMVMWFHTQFESRLWLPKSIEVGTQYLSNYGSQWGSGSADNTVIVKGLLPFPTLQRKKKFKATSCTLMLLMIIMWYY